MAGAGRYHVYILMNANGSVLYTGVTSDLSRRVAQHRFQKPGTFSARYKTERLVYVEHYGEVKSAIRREKQIKGWRRTKKEELIRRQNPQLRDLAPEWKVSS